MTSAGADAAGSPSENGVETEDAPEVDLDRAQIVAALNAIGLADDGLIDQIFVAVEHQVRTHRTWSSQDGRGPRRTERNEARRVLLKACRSLQQQLRALDEASMQWLDGMIDADHGMPFLSVYWFMAI